MSVRQKIRWEFAHFAGLETAVRPPGFSILGRCLLLASSTPQNTLLQGAPNSTASKANWIWKCTPT